MGTVHRHGIESTASIAGHPIHPILIPFPIAFLAGALATDILYWSVGGTFWPLASFWLLAAGLVMGALAAVIGLIDFLTIADVRRLAIAWIHFLGNGLVMLLAAVNLWWRWNDAAAPVLEGGMLLSLLTVGLLGITGWLGGELVFRHRIGVMDTGEVELGAAPELESAKQRPLPRRDRDKAA